LLEMNISSMSKRGGFVSSLRRFLGGASTVLTIAVAMATPPPAAGALRASDIVFLVYRYTPCLPESGVIISLEGESATARTDSRGTAQLSALASKELRAHLIANGRAYEVVVEPRADSKTYVSVDLAGLERVR
jgi:hypothetical protein